ncbi:MAG: peptide chain release factor N(5)-glutamine methyltransferase [Gemmataceae bacterium]|nr:peptide chain release factor N(5)-glutamine methyltransferase [Gemmataceae bacterium]
MVAEQTWTLGALLDWTAQHLAQKGMEFPRLDAEVLLAHAASCKRIDLYGIRHAEHASPETRQKYRDLIRRRMEGCPVAYLVGRKEFFGLEFDVTPAVLIPRPDSEHVVMECLALAKGVEHASSLVRIADIGSGSGNLAVALAKQLPKAQVTAMDASPDALAVARKNAQKHDVAERVRFMQSDLFAALTPNEQFHFVVSNPPYIASEEMSKLPPGVRDYEPKAALDGGPGGFTVFDRLIDAARHHLSSGGHLLVEIGAPQEERARERIAGFREYELAPTIHDYSGHPRVLKARRV